MRRAIALGLGLGITLLSAANASGQERRYTYVPVGSFGEIASAGSPLLDVNASGQAVGTGESGAGHGKPLLWEEGSLSNLGALFDQGAGSATGINDAGDVVGWTYTDAYSSGQAFVRRDGVLTLLGGSGGAGAPTAINNDGLIVGSRRSASGERGFLWRDGVYTDLGSLGGSRSGQYSTTTTAEDINDRGQIVGSSVPAGSGRPLHPYLWENGVMRDLGILGPDDEASQAFAINNHGVVAGSSYKSFGLTVGVVWEDGQIRELDSLGDDGATPSDINDAGQVVGYSVVSGYTLHATLWEDGELHDLNDLVTNLPGNVELAVANAINEDGVIVGKTCTSYCSEGKTARGQGFVLIPEGMPVPTPAPVLLDLSYRAAPVTVAGVPPVSSPGRWVDALRFNGGRLLVPSTPVPLQHEFAAWIKPDAGVTGEQVIVASAGAKLVYDGTHRRINYYVTGVDGRVAAAASLPGSFDAATLKHPLLVNGGVRATGEVVVTIEGRMFSSGQFATSIAPSGTTPFSVGATASGAQPFRGLIETAHIRPYAANKANYRLPWTGYAPVKVSMFIWHDVDQTPPDLNDLTFSPSPPTPKPGPNDHQSPAPVPDPTPSPTSTPAATPTSTPSPSPTPTSSPAATPSPSPTATPSTASTPSPSATPSPTPTATPTATPSPSATPTPSPTPPAPSPSPASTPSPTATPTPPAAPTPSPSPASTPSPTATPSPSPTATPGPVFAPPAPAITAPASYTWHRTSTITVTGTAQPGATVELFDGATALGTTVATALGTWSRPITVAGDGACLVTARARTVGGTSPSSAMRVLQVDTRAPAAPVITAPASAAATSFTLTGTAEAGTTVEVFENGSSRGTVAASGGSWTKSFSGVAGGTRSYTAIATDMAGNRSALSTARALTIN